MFAESAQLRNCSNVIRDLPLQRVESDDESSSYMVVFGVNCRSILACTAIVKPLEVGPVES